MLSSLKTDSGRRFISLSVDIYDSLSPSTTTPYLTPSSCSCDSFLGVDDIEMTPKPSLSDKRSMATSSRKIKQILTPKAKKLKYSKHKQNHKINNRKRSKSQKSNVQKQIRWRPSLCIIYKDELLLNALIAFCEKRYNAENILFLLAVRHLANDGIDDGDGMNEHIDSIYDLYIVSSAKYKINVSYACYMDVISKISTFRRMTMMEKCQLFNHCVDEIERLMAVSVLPSFYNSKYFQNVAAKSKYFDGQRIRSKSLKFNNKRMESLPSTSLGLTASSSEICQLNRK